METLNPMIRISSYMNLCIKLGVCLLNVNKTVGKDECFLVVPALFGKQLFKSYNNE